MSQLCVATPYSRSHYGGYVRSLLFMDTRDGVEYIDPFGMALDQARNYIVEAFLAGGAEYLLMVDNDATFHRGAAQRLMDHNLPMVCGCMYTTGVPPKPTMGLYSGKAANGKHYYSFAKVAQEIISTARLELGEELPKENALLFRDPRLMMVDGCGMHFAMIRRDVLATVRPPWFVFTGDRAGGEDFYFCRKVREAGFPIYVDLSVHTGHATGEREGADFGLRELLTCAQYMPVENLVDVETENWEV